MATSYPGNLDNFTNPAPGDVVASALIGNMADAIEALETEVGKTTSPASGSVRKRLADLEAVGGGGGDNSGNALLHGLKAWSVDPATGNGSTTALTGGTLYLSSIWIDKAITATNVVVFMQSAAGNIFTALFTSAGALLSQSTSAATATGVNTRPLGAAQSLAAGSRYYIGVWVSSGCNAYRALGSVDLINFNLGSGTYRSASANTGLTSTAPSNLGAMTALSGPLIVGIS